MEEHENSCCEKLEKGILLSCCVALSLKAFHVSFSAGSPVKDWGCVGKCVLSSSVRICRYVCKINPIQIQVFRPHTMAADLL